MTPLKPYLIRSVYDWIIDNQLTPHLLVDAENHESVLPENFIENGKIVLNIRPEAIQGLILGNEEIQFNARFSGESINIITPTTAVLAIYAKENGKGMIFDQEEHNETPPTPEKKPSRPQLRVVK
ncbi:MAG: ClpXP protease specificity-enhancing factor [Methylococcales symbiont of Hymedesmia sp. n. MRB-2018]|nr:MAG: ClpXP protease specificity-enhancing factor [Methylococcales symbiont of Hymedesmia sp. n. MRB-2018]KAF3983884.1 MAG: ClpXP protease specificity-enhancing factor [Methylococcales symbiont of Hymedesmia sp. n. MRB-2018]